MRIYLVRHGRQSSTCCNVDVSLAEAGRKQAALAGQRLAGYGIDAIYSSDMKRAMETAQIIAEEIEKKEKKKLSIAVRPGIREYNCGDMEGLTEEEQEERFGAFLEERETFVDVPYPGGESGADVYRRYLPVLQEIAESGFQQVAVATHGGAIRAVLAGLFFQDENRKLLWGRGLENGSITELLYREKDHTFYLERFNDYAHLEADTGLLRKSWKKHDRS